jgi:hypothetical protein
VTPGWLRRTLENLIYPPVVLYADDVRSVTDHQATSSPTPGVRITEEL